MLSAPIAAALSKHTQVLDLNGVRQLTPASAAMLAKRTGSSRGYLDLSLNGLTTLSDATAAKLAQGEGSLELNGLKKLPDATIAILAKFRGNLSLKGLTSLSDAGAAALRRHAWGEIYLREAMLARLSASRRKAAQEAIELLLRTAQPVSAIGKSMGFTDPNHFSKFFRREEGLSPSGYRAWHGPFSGASAKSSSTRKKPIQHKKFVADKILKIKALSECGSTSKSISMAVGVSLSTVYIIRKELGLLRLR